MSDPQVQDHITALLDRGEYAKASIEAEAALALAPDDPGVLALLADARAGIVPDEALEPALRAAARQPDAPSILLVLGRIQWLTGRRGPAMETAERVVELAPGWAEAHAVHAVMTLEGSCRAMRSSLDAGLLDQAASSITRAVRLAPNWPLAHTILGQIHLAGDERDRAAKAGVVALSLDADHQDGNVLVGDVHLANGDRGGAMARYIRARPSPIASERLRSMMSDSPARRPWVPGLIALGAGAVLDMTDVALAGRLSVSLIASAILLTIVARSIAKVRRAAANHHRDTRCRLGPSGELARRTRPRPEPHPATAAVVGAADLSRLEAGRTGLSA